MNDNIDILGLGFVAVDELLYVDAYPAADAKTQIRHRERQCGGLAATALVAAARMGCRCAYAGALGEDEHSQFVLRRFREEGVDVSHVRHRVDARPVRSTIIVDGQRHTRTILYDLSGVDGADSSWPPEDLIRSVKALLVDHCGVEGMIRAAEIARHAGIPVVADIEGSDHPDTARLMELADHLILSCGFARKITGENDPAMIVQALGSPGRRVAAVTCGKDGCWYVSDQQPGISCHQPALAVETVDTTGCGDVFHGAYAAALVHGFDVPSTVRFATAAAGLKAARPGGQSGIPSRNAVEAEMAKADRP
jgi:sulfofructose kinase